VVVQLRRALSGLVILFLLSTLPVFGQEDRFRQEQLDTFHQCEVLSLSWGPPGSQVLATGSRLGKIRIWYPGLRLPGFTLEGENKACIRALSWADEGKVIAGAGDYFSDGSYTEGWVFIWDVQGKLLRFAKRVSSYPVLSLCAHPQLPKFALGVGALLSPDFPLPEGEVQVWEIDQKAPTKVLKLGNGSVASLGWSPDGSHFASAIWRPFSGDLSGEARIWDGENFDEFQVVGQRPYTSLAWSPDGTKLALGFGSGFWEGKSETGGLEVFDLTSATSLILDTWGAVVKSVSWSPDSSLIACGDSQGVIRIYTPEGVLKQKLERHFDSVNGVSWKKTKAEEKPVLASVSDDGTSRTYSFRPPTFSDIGGHWAEDYIDSLVERGAVSGFPDNSFRPETPVTRAQFVKLLLLSLGIQPDGQGTAPFSDLTAGHWACSFIATAYQRGLVLGYPDGTFQPEKFLSRAEAITFIARALNWKDEQLKSLPGDVDFNYWAAPFVSAFFTHQALFLPDPPFISQDLFFPYKEITRAETCFVLERALRRAKPLI